MALNAAEKERARYHLGYLGTAPAASIQLGIPRPLQTVFLVEDALNSLTSESEDRVRRILRIMDGVECKLCEAQDRLAAKQLDALQLRDNEPDQLEREYVRWGQRLADVLGVPLYPYSNRYRNAGGTAAGSIPVR